jgi:hypothetical protein
MGNNSVQDGFYDWGTSGGDFRIFGSLYGATIGEDTGADPERQSFGVVPRVESIDTELILAEIGWGMSNDFTNIELQHQVGFIDRHPEDGALSDRAVFLPHEGENNLGNFQVVSGGVVSEGQVDFGEVGNGFINYNSYAAILLDYGSERTQVYFGDSPYYGSPTETIDAVPEEQPPLGVSVEGQSPPSEFEASNMTIARLTYVI